MDFPGRDGARLAYQEIGAGRALILIHGHQERGSRWAEAGPAGRLVRRLAGRGHRVIMPDLRAHGNSAKPHDPASYPRDVLADDGLALVDHLGLTDYDLGGHSLGGRTVIRMLARGAAPRRAVVSGQGLEGILHGADPGHTKWYQEYFGAFGTGVFEPGSDEQETEDWLLSIDENADPRALRLAIGSWVNSTLEELAAITVPTLIVTGADEVADATAQELADAFRHGRQVTVPGDHFTAKQSPEFEEAVAAFLAE